MEAPLNTNETVPGLDPIEYSANVIPDDRWVILPPSVSGMNFPEFYPLIGAKVIDGRLMGCGPEDIVTIATTLARTALVNESPHVPLIYEASFSRTTFGALSDAERRARNTEWLRIIAAGYWPEPGVYGLNARLMSNDKLCFSDHDLSGLHILNALLEPRDKQEAITEAAKQGLRRRNTTDGSQNDTEGALPEPPEDDNIELPWSLPDHLRTYSYENIDAIYLIDALTNKTNLPNLMHTLLQIDSDQERSVFMERHLQQVPLRTEQEDTGTHDTSAPFSDDSADMWDDELDELNNVQELMRDFAILINFNSRCRDGKNLTQAEIHNATMVYMNGIVRVANSLASSN